MSGIDLERERAAKAYGIVGGLNDKKAEEYAPVASGAGALIQSAGLAQALAFYRSRKPDHAERNLFDHFTAWLRVAETTKSFFANITNGDNTLKALFTLECSKLALCEDEAAAYLVWLKQFAEARKKDIEEEEERRRRAACAAEAEQG